MNVRCPHCQVIVPLSPKRQSGHVYTSRGIEICGKFDETTGLTGSALPGTPSPIYAYFDLQSYIHWIAECINCHGEFIYLTASGKPVWPLPEATVDKEIPEKVAKVFLEAKKAHAVGAETAALLAARTALLRALRELNRLSWKDLVDRGEITSLLYTQANEIRLWANVIGHEDMPVDAPEPQDVEQLLSYLDLLFNTLYVQPAQLQRLREKRQTLS